MTVLCDAGGGTKGLERVLMLVKMDDVRCEQKMYQTS